MQTFKKGKDNSIEETRTKYGKLKRKNTINVKNCKKRKKCTRFKKMKIKVSKITQKLLQIRL